EQKRWRRHLECGGHAAALAGKAAAWLPQSRTAVDRSSHRRVFFRTMRARVLTSICCFFLTFSVYARTLTVDDFAKLRSVSDPQVSPDGKWIAYTVGTIDAEKDKRDSDLWMVSWDGADRL